MSQNNTLETIDPNEEHSDEEEDSDLDGYRVEEETKDSQYTAALKKSGLSRDVFDSIYGKIAHRFSVQYAYSSPDLAAIKTKELDELVRQPGGQIAFELWCTRMDEADRISGTLKFQPHKPFPGMSREQVPTFSELRQRYSRGVSTSTETEDAIETVDESRPVRAQGARPVLGPSKRHEERAIKSKEKVAKLPDNVDDDF